MNWLIVNFIKNDPDTMTVLEKSGKKKSVVRFLNNVIFIGTVLSYIPTGYQLVKIFHRYLKWAAANKPLVFGGST